MKLQAGQRIEVFEIHTNGYSDTKLFTIGSHYAEVAGNPYSGNPYGRDMICNAPLQFGRHLNIPDHMRPVGAMIIKEVKG